jgi:hypothetical protein
MPSDEAIFESFIEFEILCEDMHDISFFLHELEKLEVGTKVLISCRDIK